MQKCKKMYDMSCNLNCMNKRKDYVKNVFKFVRVIISN